MNAFQELENFFCDQYFDLAISLAKRGRWSDAEAQLKRIESLDPLNADVSLLRARMSYHSGHCQDALEHILVSESRGADPGVISAMREDIVSSDWKRLKRVRRVQEILWGRGAHSRPRLRALEEAVRLKTSPATGLHSDNSPSQEDDSSS